MCHNSRLLNFAGGRGRRTLEASLTSRGVATEAEPAYDPYRDDARLIWDATRALKDGVGGIHDRLSGQGRPNHGPLRDFQAVLERIEEEINSRNTLRPNYPSLLPSQSPQSINI